MRPPKNQLIEKLYTKGNEFMLIKTYENYVGYYHCVSGKYYIGADYKENAIQLIPFTKEKSKIASSFSNINPLYTKLNNNIIKNIKKNTFNITRIQYIPTITPTERFFIKTRSTPSPIIEVNNITHFKATNSPLYYTLKILWDINKNYESYYPEWEKEMPGIKQHLNSINTPIINDITN